MSRLLGIVNPNEKPDDPFKYWLWQADGNIIPAAAEWDFERLNVYTTPAPDGNVCVWVTGPPTERYRDGVFVRMFVNPDLQPTPRTTADAIPPELQQSWETAIESRTPLTPRADM